MHKRCRAWWLRELEPLPPLWEQLEIASRDPMTDSIPTKSCYTRALKVFVNYEIRTIEQVRESVRSGAVFRMKHMGIKTIMKAATLLDDKQLIALLEPKLNKAQRLSRKIERHRQLIAKSERKIGIYQQELRGGLDA